MSSIIKTNEIQNSSGGADVKIQALKHPSSSSNNITLASTGIVTMASGNGYRLNSIQTFTDPSANGTATNTWTKPANVNAVLVYVTGGGGGGASGDANFNHGGGGHAGGTAIKWINSNLGATEIVTVGNFGTGGTSDANGNPGSSSHFGSHCSATGGGEGIKRDSSDAVTSVGYGIGGNINIHGGFGMGQGPNHIEAESAPRNGGASFWGGGGMGAHDYNNYYATTGLAYGSGGGGGHHSGTYKAGKEGHEGIIVVWEYIG